MGAKRKFLTRDEYEEIAHSAEWHIVELDLSTIRAAPGIQRKDDVLGVFASGDANASKLLNNQDAILGMDVIVYECRPKTEAGEWFVNAYHYVVTHTGHRDYPYCLHGPFTKETLIGHWPPCLDLSPYEKSGHS